MENDMEIMAAVYTHHFFLVKAQLAAITAYSTLIYLIILTA